MSVDMSVVKARMEAERAGREAMDALGDLVNGGGPEARAAFVKQFHKQHRTLQQAVIRLMVEVVLDLAKVSSDNGPGWYDLRNQGAVEFSRKVRSMVEGGEVHLPYI